MSKTRLVPAILSARRCFSMIAVAFSVLCCGDPEAFEHAGFSVSWMIETPDGVALDCDIIDAYKMEITIEDSSGQTHRHGASCTDFFFETTEWDAVKGRARVSATLNTESGEQVAESSPFSFTLTSGMLGNQLPDIVFEIPREQFADKGPTFSLSFEIDNGAGGLSACNDIGVRYVDFSLTDNSDHRFLLGMFPCESFGTIDSPPMPLFAFGEALLAVSFRNADMVEIAANEIPLFFEEAEAVVVGPLSLYAPPLYFRGESPLQWIWTDDEAYLDEARCEAIDFDSVRLYIRNEAISTFWSDESWMTAPCAAQAHSVDKMWVEDDVFSGLYFDGVIPAGEYAFSLGFYRHREIAGGLFADQLVHLHTEGTKDHPVRIDDDALNVFRVPLDRAIPNNRELDVRLEWQTDEGTFGSCDQVDASGLAIRLSNEASVAVDMAVDPGTRCRDALRFSNLPSSDEGYLLTVVGLSPDGAVEWHGRCDISAADMDADTASCSVMQQ